MIWNRILHRSVEVFRYCTSALWRLEAKSPIFSLESLESHKLSGQCYIAVHLLMLHWIINLSKFQAPGPKILQGNLFYGRRDENSSLTQQFLNSYLDGATESMLAGITMKMGRCASCRSCGQKLLAQSSLSSSTLLISFWLKQIILPCKDSIILF